MRREMGMSFVILTALAFTMVLVLPIAQVAAAENDTFPPYVVTDQEYSNGCYYPLDGEYCINAANTGQANQYSYASASSCCCACGGAVGPFSTYVYYDDKGSPNGDSYYYTSGQTMHYSVAVQYNGYVQTSYTQGDALSPAAVFAMESFLYKPDGSHITNIWDIALLNNGAEGTDFVTSCGYPSSWCAYSWSQSAPETGTYWLGGGFGTGAGADYNDQGGSSAAAVFGETGGADFATVGWFAMS